jgi:hypothetical protein
VIGVAPVVGVAGATGASTDRPHVGQVPSSRIADGAQYFAQSSHHGTNDP